MGRCTLLVNFSVSLPRDRSICSLALCGALMGQEGAGSSRDCLKAYLPQNACAPSATALSIYRSTHRRCAGCGHMEHPSDPDAAEVPACMQLPQDVTLILCDAVGNGAMAARCDGQGSGSSGPLTGLTLHVPYISPGVPPTLLYMVPMGLIFLFTDVCLRQSLLYPTVLVHGRWDMEHRCAPLCFWAEGSVTIRTDCPL